MMMELKIVCFPGCHWKEKAIKLGKGVAETLDITFKYEERRMDEVGVSPTIFLNDQELFPAGTGPGCRVKLPSLRELCTEIKARL